MTVTDAFDVSRVRRCCCRDLVVGLGRVGLDLAEVWDEIGARRIGAAHFVHAPCAGKSKQHWDLPRTATCRRAAKRPAT